MPSSLFLAFGITEPLFYPPLKPLLRKGTTRITQLSTRRPQHRADVAAPVREAAPAPVETPAAAQYEESESENSFEVPRVYPEAPEKEELDIPPFLR